jgi:hypothetical protein
MNGTGWAAGHKHENLRALFAMYETSFQIAVLRKNAIASLAGLNGKKVGVGPAKGPAEVFFRAAAEAAQVTPVIVNGDPAELVRQLLAGEIDALWQGAAVPIASLRAVTDQADAIVFGLTEAEAAAMLQKISAARGDDDPARKLQRPNRPDQERRGVEFRGRQQRPSRRCRLCDHQDGAVGRRSENRNLSGRGADARRERRDGPVHAVPSRRAALL